MNTFRLTQPQPAPGDYYGTIYKGSLIVPIVVILGVAIGLWWLIKRRR